MLEQMTIPVQWVHLSRQHHFITIIAPYYQTITNASFTSICVEEKRVVQNGIIVMFLIELVLQVIIDKEC